MKTRSLLLGYYVHVGVALDLQNHNAPSKGHLPSLSTRYLVSLNRECTLDQHFHNIRALRTSQHFADIVDLISFTDIYIGSFPPNVRSRIESDHECVRNIVMDQRAQNVRRMLDNAASKPNRASTDASGSDPGSYYYRTWGYPNEVGKEPPHAEQRTWKLSSESPAPWQLLTMAIGEKQVFGTTSRGKSQAKELYNYVSDAGNGVDIYHFGYFGPATQMSEFREKNGRFKFSQGQSRAFVFKRYESDTFSPRDDLQRGVSEASLAAGLKYGVGKSANIFGVEVSSAGGILEAFRDILQEHNRKLGQTEGYRGAVISLNLAVAKPELLYEIEYAIRKLDDAGILVVAPAGDQGRSVGAEVSSGRDGSGSPSRLLRRDQTREDVLQSLDYPCKFGRVLCVGAVDRLYRKASFSGYGKAVHMYAPGVDVSIVPPYDKDPAITNGTNLASALVTGFAATVLSYEGQHRQSLARDTYGLRRLILGNCKRNYLEGLGLGSRNLLANTGIRSTDDPSRPYLHGSIWAQIKDEDFLVSSGRNNILNDYDQFTSLLRLECFATHSPRRITWFEAEKLYLRLEWERGHSASFDNEDELFPVFCVETACVYLKYTSESTFRIPDAAFLADCLLRVLSGCKENEPGIWGPSAPTTGGRLEITDYSEGWPTKLTFELGKELSP